MAERMADMRVDSLVVHLVCWLGKKLVDKSDSLDKLVVMWIHLIDLMANK